MRYLQTLATEEMPMTREPPQTKILKTDEEWRAILTPDQFNVARKHGTERAFTGPNWDQKKPGLYACVCCGEALFDASTKYDSGTGWPSFYEPVAADVVDEVVDASLFMRRTEVRCAKCDAHLGHVFPDGPAPTGQRYCMNGQALAFQPSDK
jgi:peptide-methionine (R)-S-oxide reductase